MANAFPDIRYEGGLQVRLYSNAVESDVEPFPVGVEVFAKIGEEPNGDTLMAEARVISVPTPVTDFYQIRVVESQEMVSCKRTELIYPDQTLGVDTAHLPSGLDSDDEEDPFSLTLPDWIVSCTFQRTCDYTPSKKAINSWEVHYVGKKDYALLRQTRNLQTRTHQYF